MSRKNDKNGSVNPDANDEIDGLFPQDDPVVPTFEDDDVPVVTDIDDMDMQSQLDDTSPQQLPTTANTSTTQLVRRTRNQIIDETTDAYIASLDRNNLPSPETISIELVQKIQDAFDIENATKGKGSKFRAPDQLSFDQIAQFMAILFPIVRISCAGASADTAYDLLGLYMDSGPDEGTYVTSEEEFYKIARRFNRRLESRQFDEAMKVLRTIVPRRLRCMDKDLIAVNNGIFNYDTKQLEPFSPDIVFMTKSHVNYNQSAVNVIIHNDDDGTDWDVESWMNELSDDPEIVELLWQILGAIIRPHVRWNKSAWLYSETGNNGKGTLCELMRSMCGETAFASIPISDFGKDFALEPLTRATAIIVDENDVGAFIDKAANLKAVITNDVIPINRKFKTPISYQFYGFMVQCLNEFPRIRDKSDSFYRRQLFIPFDKCFTGRERKYIKNDYLHRSEVLEYVMYKVLNMNFYTLSEPVSCRNALEEYKDYNDPVRQFLDDMLLELKWDLVPFSFMYDLYKAWFRKNSPNGSLQGKNTFIMDVTNLLQNYPDWTCIGRQTAIRPGHMMDAPEPLIAEYNLEDWKNPNYTGGDINRICTPQLKATYNGIRRLSKSGGTDASDNTSDEE